MSAKPLVPWSYEDIKKNIVDQVVNNRKKRQSTGSSQSTQGSAKRKPFFGKKQKKVVQVYKVPECYTMPINGVHVSLPAGLTPYRTQKLMMVRILQAIIRSQNALAESPTGSGKTMALLASSCAWLRQYKEKRLESKESCPVHSSKEYKEMKEKEMSDLLMQPIDSQIRSVSESKFADDDEISCVYDKFDESMQKLTEGLDDDFIPAKRQNSSKAAEIAKKKAEEEEMMENFEGELTAEEKVRKEKCTCLPKVRIYYGTRTHKQIGQVVKEFGRLDHAPNLRHTILGSREQMCINEGARAHADVTGACKDLIMQGGLGCQFKSNMRPNYERPYNVREVIKGCGADVWDIDALVEALGNENGPQLCPYFEATRILTQDADIIFCPFNYMIDPIIRDMSDVHMKDAVVILDEAHNVEDICRDAASFTFSEKEIHDALSSFMEKQEAVRREILDQGNRLKGEEKGEEAVDYILRLKEFAKALENMVKTVSSLRTWLMTVSEGVRDPKPNDRFDKGTSTNGWELLWTSLEQRNLLFDRNSQKYKELQEAMMKLVEKDNPEVKNFTMDSFKPTVTALVCIEKFLYFLFYFTKEDRRSTYRLNITVERPTDAQLAAEAHHGMKKVGGGTGQTWGASYGPRNQLYTSQNVTGVDLFNEYSARTFVDPKNMPNSSFTAIRQGLRITAHMWCMSPELAYMDAFSECRTVVLASGTLCPTETLKTELGMPFNFEMEGEQVIPREQIFATVITRGPHRTQMKATFENSKNDKFIEELGMIIRSISKRTPGGVLVFFPSYRLLDRVYEWMFQATFLRQIEQYKIVVKEPRRSSELTEIMSQYEAGILKPLSFGPKVTGSLMFAVFRGKVSEGIDFADDMARCVISIGIPYPNAFDDLVLEKKKYNNENATKMRILTGDQWYTSQAYRALNQGLGRCLRHRGDWGAIVMVDERLAVPRAGAPVFAASAAASAARVSRWIRDQSVNYDAFGEFEADLESFVERMTRPVMFPRARNELISEEVEVTLVHRHPSSSLDADRFAARVHVTAGTIRLRPIDLTKRGIKMNTSLFAGPPIGPTSEKEKEGEILKEEGKGGKKKDETLMATLDIKDELETVYKTALFKLAARPDDFDVVAEKFRTLLYYAWCEPPQDPSTPHSQPLPVKESSQSENGGRSPSLKRSATSPSCSELSVYLTKAIAKMRFDLKSVQEYRKLAKFFEEVASAVYRLDQPKRARIVRIVTDLVELTNGEK
ncbi:dog-1 [Pristionchus pacificus]|uniref:Dog-1 n=1 Tax=Pristionchus pacificus TaxID=54126 RepID=A0A2A6BP98_PRIPA|nr:dog-1 [Pristionchus pacificus]|eukprot:PDM67729.1 dog-1 [Pristionchus pacificus]